MKLEKVKKDEID